MLLCPVKVCLPQQSETEYSLQEATEATLDSKAEKKKDKKAVEIDEGFFINLGINLAAVILIIGLIYYPNYRKMDFIFTFIIFNLIIFLLTFVLKYVKLSVGAAFGLFAVFSMLRYRTQGISMTDMTYLFIFIAMGLLSAIQIEYWELAVIHGVIISGTFLLDSNLIFKRVSCKRIDYENIDLIKPERYDELLADLRQRTGLNIKRVVVRRINFLRDTAVLMVYYHA